MKDKKNKIPSSDISAETVGKILELTEQLVKSSADAFKKTETALLEIRSEFSQKIDGISADLSVVSQKAEAIINSTADCLSKMDKMLEQMFNINMLTLKEGEQSRYESYNNVIFDELCALRHDLDALKEQIDTTQKERAESIMKVTENILDDTDVIKSKLMIVEEHKDGDVDVNIANQSVQSVSRALAELKQELSAIIDEVNKP